jgi:hypothetical protein
MQIALGKDKENELKDKIHLLAEVVTAGIPY